MGNPDSPKPAFDAEVLEQAPPVFYALGTSVRLKIYRSLLGGDMTVEEIVKKIGSVARDAIPILLDSGLVLKKEGLYSANPSGAQIIFEALQVPAPAMQAPQKPIDIKHELKIIYSAIKNALRNRALKDNWTTCWLETVEQEVCNAIQDGVSPDDCLLKVIKDVQSRWTVSLQFSKKQRAYLGLDKTS